MTYEVYTWMCYICAGFSVFMLMLSIFLFFKLKIIKVIGDLTGSTAQKAIKNIREQSSLTGQQGNDTTLLQNDSFNKTTILSDNQISNETTILDQNFLTEFFIEQDITFIHSQERIV